MKHRSKYKQHYFMNFDHVKKVWRYQRGNQKPKIEESQTIQSRKKRKKTQRENNNFKV